jgi:hypothetical protein
MNPRNVEALRTLLAGWYGPAVTRYGTHPVVGELIRKAMGEEAQRDLAETLASAGVLVPSALTDDEAVKIGADAVGNIPTELGEIALCVREGLERIARGESW